MEKKPLERRAYACEVRAESKDGVARLSGRPIVFDSRTDMYFFDEVIERGALDNTDLTDVRFLVNHNVDMIPLARSRRNNGNSTMRLLPDEEGLKMWADIDVENNADARALNSAVERGDITGMSFMFSIDGERWEDLESEHPTRYITNIGSIVEVSAVTFPAYAETSISARSTEALDSAREALEKAKELRNAEPVDTGDKGATNDTLLLLKEKAKLF